MKQINHSFYLDIIKRLLNASFVSWYQEKNTKSLKIIKDNKTYFLPYSGGNINSPEAYNKLIKEILDSNDGSIRKSLEEKTTKHE